MLLDRLLQVVAPPLCAGCGASAGAAEPLCATCRRELRWLGPEPVELAPPAGASAAARGCPPATVLAWAPLAYEGPARGVVRALKFKGAHRAAHAMAAQIVANAPPGWLTATTTLVPAPLHPKRARSRGYNQAGLLAAAIAARTGLPTSACLERTGSARTQVGRDRAQRLTGIAGSVHLIAPAPFRALLVDDVITTGATLVACAEALGGANAVAYARTPGR
jgi:predicted amidophosphoribosyltransferase